MSVPATSAAAYRDSTKWLASFLPITALATAGVVLGPRLLDSLAEAESFGTWVRTSWIALLAVLCLVLAIGAVLITGASVLSAEGPSFDELRQNPQRRKALSEAIGRGLAAPHYFSIEDYTDDLTRLNAMSVHDRAAATETERSVLALDTVRDWAVLQEVKDRYRVFLRTFLVATLVMGVAGIAAAAALT